MKEIRKLPASAGAQWLLDTFSLYRRAPLQLARIGLAWLLVSWVVTLLSTLIPGAAGMAVQLMTLAISPIMFGGMLYAVGEIDEGRPGLSSHLLQPIRDHRVSHLLVPLAIQVLAVLLLGALLFLMIGRVIRLDLLATAADLFHLGHDLAEGGEAFAADHQKQQRAQQQHRQHLDRLSLIHI